MSTTAELTAFRDAVKRLQPRLHELVHKAGNSRLNEGWQQWNARLERLYSEAEKPANVTVALLGTMGSGKSTLINTLVGGDILATKDHGVACTAVPCELQWGPGPDYRAEIIYFTPDEWDAELQRLVAALETTRGETDAESADQREEARITLLAVYQLPESVVADAIAPTQFPNIAGILNQLQATPAIVNSNLDELKQQIHPFLTSAAPRWPLIRCVRIVGPFPELPPELTLVDLPGTNDSNLAREAVTRRYLHKATDVWVVFNARRSLGRDVLRPELLLSLLMKGGMNQLCFVATHADDLDFDATLRELGLPVDGPLDAALQYKDQLIRQATQKVLEEALAAHGTTQFGQIEHYYLTSARDFRLHSTPTRRRGPVLETIAQTGILALRECLRNLGRDYGVGKQLKTLREGLTQLLHEGKQEAELERVRISQQLDLNASQRQAVEQAVTAATISLKDFLRQLHKTFALALEKSRQSLLEQIKGGIRRGNQELQDTVLRWRGMAWNTLSAICRGRGCFTSKTSGKHDLPAQLLQPLFETAAPVWDEYFGRVFGEKIQQINTDVKARVSAFGSELLDIIRRYAPDASSLAGALGQFRSTSEKALEEALSQVQQDANLQAKATRSDLVEDIEKIISESMAPAFREAATERAPTIKEKILKHIIPAAKECTQSAYEKIQKIAEDSTRNLQGNVVNRYDVVINTILNLAERTREQLTQAVVAGKQSELHLALKQLDVAIQELVTLAKNEGISLL